MHINPLNDAENLRQQRNLTNSQKRNNLSTKEGVVVNSTVKEGLSEAKSNYMISDEISMPAQLYTDKKIVDKIENLAKDDKRTLSNEISFILEEYLKNKEGNK